MKEAVISSGELNRYGYRIVPEGIRLDAYQKNPVLLVNHDGRILSVGKMALRLDDGQLKGTPEFDEGDPLGIDCKRKYEAGYLNAFSIDHQPISLTDDPAALLPGQTRMTVLETDLLEISIVNIPGDRGAVALGSAERDIDKIIPKLQLSIQSQTQNQDIMSLDKISKALGLSADATESACVDEITRLTGRVASAEAARIDTLIDSGRSAGVISDDNEEAYRKLSVADYDNASKLLRLSIEKASKVATTTSADNQLTAKGIIDSVKKLNGDKPDAEGETFEKLSKENPKKLNEIRRNEPERYAKLAADYAATN